VPEGTKAEANAAPTRATLIGLMAVTRILDDPFGLFTLHQSSDFAAVAQIFRREQFVVLYLDDAIGQIENSIVMRRNRTEMAAGRFKSLIHAAIVMHCRVGKMSTKFPIISFYDGWLWRGLQSFKYRFIRSRCGASLHHRICLNDTNIWRC